MLRNLVIIQTVFLTYQIILYFGCEFFQHNMHNVERPIDRSVPFLPLTSITYSFWFPLICIFPIVLYYADPHFYIIYMTAAFLEDTFSTVCYLVYPTTFERPAPPDTFGGNLMKIVYKGSFRGVNCAPSLHCSSSLLILSLSIACSAMNPLYRFLFGLCAVLIIISTQTTKQHTLLDFLTAIPMFALCLLAAVLFPASWLLTLIV